MVKSTTTLRVRYVETDQMGVAHHSAYLAWMEVARTEYLRLRGLPYRVLEEKGYRMPVLAIALKYKSPAYYDDELQLTAGLVETNRLRFRFEYEIRRSPDGALLATGTSEHVSTDLAGKPRRLPDKLFSLIGDGSEKH